jgi:hypothetical protein
MFEKASRIKLRFPISKGLLSVEDLWDIPLISKNDVCLDSIAKNLNNTIKNANTESFVLKSVERDTTSELAFEIVKHIIKVRLEEEEARSIAKANRDKKQQLLALIAQKETEQLAGQSLEELRKQVESM